MDRPLIWKARALDNAAESKAEGELIGETRGIEKGKASTSLCVAAVLSAFFAAGVSAQNMDTAYVPFRVNVDATATAQLAGGEKFEKLVRAGSTDTLHIISESTTPISMGKTPRPVAMHSSRGKISLELSRQLYKGVDIAIYSLNGKQIMHVKADASEVLKSISHPNVRMGVYVLSVKGVGGSIFTTRLTHSGGGMNIDVSFANEKFFSGSLMEKALPGNWTITVSAEGHLDTSYAFVPETGRGNTLVQKISLRQTSSSSDDEPSSSSEDDEPSSSSSEEDEPSSSSSSEEDEPLSSSSAEEDEPLSSSSEDDEPLSSSSEEDEPLSSSSEEDEPSSSSSEEDEPLSSSSEEDEPSSSSSEEDEPLSSSSEEDEPSSSSSSEEDEPPVTLTCGSVREIGTSGTAITPPALTCDNGKTATNTVWSASAPTWSNPKPGTYSDISVTATCGTASGLTANCSGSLNVSCTARDNNSTHYCFNGTMKAYGYVTYSGQTYKTVVIGTQTQESKTFRALAIGTQTWMAENLNYNPGTGNSACYNGQTSNCTKYGRLYDWATAMKLSSSCNSSSCSNQIQSPHRGICPEGWHIPSDADWDALMAAVGGSSTAGTKLKAASGWNSNGNGTDDYGFSALPAGDGTSVSSFEFVGDLGHYRSATEKDANNAYFQYMSCTSKTVLKHSDFKSRLFSVRCVQD